jgi:hypothetical protein
MRAYLIGHVVKVVCIRPSLVGGCGFESGRKVCIFVCVCAVCRIVSGLCYELITSLGNS